ncbi:MAG: hypothetical protein H5T99_11230 [Moorella sp. (in: Bacteria)]|nr:hypothetical protein [Moorella sp. (in: firmicutes)]
MNRVVARSFRFTPEPSLIVERCLQSLQKEMEKMARACIDRADEYIGRVICQGQPWAETFYNLFLSPETMNRLTEVAREVVSRETGYASPWMKADQLGLNRMDASLELAVLQQAVEDSRWVLRLTAFSGAVQQWACRQVWENAFSPLPAEAAAKLMPAGARKSTQKQRDMEYNYLKGCITGLVQQIWRRLKQDICQQVAGALYRWYEQTEIWNAGEGIPA